MLKLGEGKPESRTAPGGTEIAEEILAVGMSHLERGKLRQAGFQFAKALLIAPDYRDAALALGHCLHLQQMYSEALAVYDRLLSASPSMPEGWNNRGNCLLEMRRF